jgi:hypothetical protein
MGATALAGCGLLVASAAVAYGLGAALLVGGLILLAVATFAWAHSDTPLSEPLPPAVIPPRDDAARLAATRAVRPPGLTGSVPARPQTLNVGRRHGA